MASLLLAGCACAGTLQAAPLDQALDAAAAAQHDAARSQQRIESLDDQTRSLLLRWRESQHAIAELERYQAQLQSQTAAQATQLTEMERSLDEITSVERQIVPLMLEMAETLRSFVGVDLPFLLDERTARLDRLDAALARPDLDHGEQFRRLVEAWNIEAGYGRVLEAWPGEVERNGAALQVEFLRVGRVALLYRTLDGRAGATWDRTTGAWQDLPGTQLGELRKAIQVAREERAPDLLLLPVPTAERPQ